MSTSDKLTYLNETKTQIRKGLNKLGADLTSEDTFRSYVAELDEIYDSLPKVENETASESVTLTPTLKAQMTLDLLGNTSQDSTTGKNLLNLSGLFQTKFSGNTTSDKGITFTNNNGTINLKGTATGTAECIIGSWNGPAALLELDSSKTYTLKIFGKDKNGSTIYAGADIRGIKNGSGAKIIYGNDTADYVTITGWSSVVYFDIYTNYTGGETNKDISIQIEESSSPTSYEPYTNGASPNPDYPQQIHTCSGDNTIKVEGKNLYSRDNGQYNVPVYAPDGTSASYQDVNVVWIKVTPNTDYSFTLQPNSTPYYVRIIQCDSNKGFIVRETQLNSSSSQVVTTTKTLRSNCEWLQIAINQYATAQISQNNWELMVEKSSTPTTYEPYTSQSHLISLGDIELNKIVTYKDRIFKAENGDEYYDSLTQEQKELLDYGKWYLHKEIGKVVLNGSENWTYEGSSNRFCTTVSGSWNSTSRSPIISNYFIYVSSGNPDGGGFNYNQLIYLINHDYSTTDTFKTWLSNNNTIVYYVLATPTNTEITDTTLISQLENIYSIAGTTNITQENNDLAMSISAKALRGE